MFPLLEILLSFSSSSISILSPAVNVGEPVPAFTIVNWKLLLSNEVNVFPELNDIVKPPDAISCISCLVSTCASAVCVLT